MTKMASDRVSEEYETYEEKLKKYFQGYTVDKNFICVALPETPEVKFSSYISMLKSKNLEFLEKNQWIFEGAAKFLDKSE